MRVLDVHAPLRTARRLCSGQHDTYVLSDEAQQAKGQHRRLERRYRRTGLQFDKQTNRRTTRRARQHEAVS